MLAYVWRRTRDAETRPQTSLGPGDHLSQGLYAVGLAFVGNHDEALAYARRAFALNQEGWRFEVRVQ
jgi:hypothetical protein